MARGLCYNTLGWYSERLLLFYMADHQMVVGLLYYMEGLAMLQHVGITIFHGPTNRPMARGLCYNMLGQYSERLLLFYMVDHQMVVGLLYYMEGLAMLQLVVITTLPAQTYPPSPRGYPTTCSAGTLRGYYYFTWQTTKWSWDYYITWTDWLCYNT